MQYPRLETNCSNCHNHMPALAFFDAPEISGYKVCHSCYSNLRAKVGYVSDALLVLYFALKKQKITAVLENSAEFKKVHIAIDAVKLYIAVDGDHDYTDHKQAKQDLQRTFYSLQHDFVTIRVPNTLIENELQEACNYLSEIVSVRQKKMVSTNAWVKSSPF
ncbi:MAG: hypothetical protein QM802_02790 [Agriterribacter sp.]